MTNDNHYDRVPDAELRKLRASAFTRVLGSLVGWGMFFGLALGALGFWAWGVFTSEGPLKETKIITLAEGQSRADIAMTLEKEGIISDSRVMNAASFVNSVRGGTLKSGEYEFIAGTPMAGVLSAVSAGKVLTYKLTVPEGWTAQMALERLNANDVLTGDPVTTVPEGAIIADTQVFRRGMTKAKMLEDMVSAQAKLVDEIWAKRAADNIIKTKEEMVTLASIVEKETAKADERPRIAGVFLNRLKKGMRLQSDPTIIYGIVGGAGKLDRPLTRSDIDAKTPYNTYQIDGLPPGPIAVPGRASMEAVADPLETQELFFVADGTGGHAFAVTLDEHNANVKKWRDSQKNGIQLPGEAPEAEPEPINDVQQTPLPAVETTTPADPAIDEAADTAKKAQTVPDPAEGAAAEQPVIAKPKAAEPPPLPTAKKPKPVVVKEAPVEKPKPAAEKKPAAAKEPPVPAKKPSAAKEKPAAAKTPVVPKEKPAAAKKPVVAKEDPSAKVVDKKPVKPKPIVKKPKVIVP